MPLPKPRKGEGQKDFMARCMHESDLPTGKDPKHNQRLAACMDAWRAKQRAEWVPEIAPPVEASSADGPPPVSA